MNIQLNVNGFDVQASYTEKTISSVFLPLLRELTECRKQKGKRLMVYLSAPPGAGKTTLSLSLEKLFKEQDFPFSFQAISIDGFHYRKKYLMSHSLTVNGKEVSLNDVKGSPESFDVSCLTKAVSELQHRPVSWPIYDRNLHDVSDETIQVDADIVFIEGNWLLLDEEEWRELDKYGDVTIFIEASEPIVKPRLIERKIKGGLTEAEAEAFYHASDKKNVFRILKNHRTADRTLTITESGEIMNRENGLNR